MPNATSEAAQLDDIEVRPIAFSANAPARLEFADVDTWIFDLDNTLYPADSDLWPKIDQRITAFMIHLFGLDGISARALQKYYYRRYGTTLRGLMINHGVDPHAFLEFVHDIDRSALLPNLPLAEAIMALPGRKLILTNGSRAHARLTAEALGLATVFEDIFDIVDAELVPKPERATYEKFFAKHHVDPKTAAMFEDIDRNLCIPHEKGMITVLVVPKPGCDDRREPFEIAASQNLPHVDFVSSDLERFLRDIAAHTIPSAQSAES
ncbi:MAG: pyrimidine 5'-nucleotidase [Beijerinckiaceae bacterium]|nr:MAG: pyrimidine 5'-nucleotidase [Beijerinckiaceae bacterium]